MKRTTLPRQDLAKRALRKARREQKKADSQALMDALGGSVEADGTPRIPPVGPGTLRNGPGRARTPVRVPRQAKSRKSKPRRKKSLFVRLRDALDREAQSYAAERDRALGCRIRKAAQCSGRSEVGYHIIPRGKWRVRWDLDFMGIGNIVGACSPCNAGENWHRLEYAEHHKKIFGEKFYAALWDLAHSKYEFKSQDLQALLDDIRKRRSDLN